MSTISRKVTFLIAIVSILAVPAAAQFFFPMPVLDAANLDNALDRHFQLQRQYAQLVTTYNQLVAQYRHMRWMAQKLEGLSRLRFPGTPWLFSQSANTYGTTAAWTQAVNSGASALDGYRQAVEELSTYGGALAGIPHDQLDKLRTDYATVELADSANIHSMRVLGSQRARARSREERIDMLEAETLTLNDEAHTQIAVLNKINAANVMALRAGQDTNQLLVALLEQQLTDAKARRDAETRVINENIAYRINAYEAGMRGIRETTDALTSFTLP